VKPGVGADYPASNPQKDIAAALALATKDGKPVLLDFGADWCVDCSVLARLFRDPSVEPFLRTHFHLVVIDLGEYFRGSDAMRNPAVALQFGIDPMQTGVPALVLLNPNGKITPIRGDVQWHNARTFSVEEALRYLRELSDAAR
jgi:thioredoxin 1